MLELMINVVHVVVPKNRVNPGVISFPASDGLSLFVNRCLAISDLTLAIKAGNPSRNVLSTYGDLPTGTFEATRIAPAVATLNEPNPLHSYGPGPRWALIGKSGDALLAMKNRSGLLIHGGELRADLLRPTFGCLRVDDSTIVAVARTFETSSFELIVSEI